MQPDIINLVKKARLLSSGKVETLSSEYQVIHMSGISQNRFAHLGNTIMTDIPFDGTHIFLDFTHRGKSTTRLEVIRKKFKSSFVVTPINETSRLFAHSVKALDLPDSFTLQYKTDCGDRSLDTLVTIKVTPHHPEEYGEVSYTFHKIF